MRDGIRHIERVHGGYSGKVINWMSHSGGEVMPVGGENGIEFA